jgi:hypothetical protein
MADPVPGWDIVGGEVVVRALVLDKHRTLL